MHLICVSKFNQACLLIINFLKRIEINKVIIYKTIIFPFVEPVWKLNDSGLSDCVSHHIYKAITATLVNTSTESLPSLKLSSCYICGQQIGRGNLNYSSLVASSIKYVSSLSILFIKIIYIYITKGSIILKLQFPGKWNSLIFNKFVSTRHDTRFILFVMVYNTSGYCMNDNGNTYMSYIIQYIGVLYEQFG